MVSQVSVFGTIGFSKTQKLQHETGFRVDLFALEDAPRAPRESAELLVQCDQCGDGWSISSQQVSFLPDKLLVADVIYQPFETPIKVGETRAVTLLVWVLILYQAL